jgi:hypothetical protein
MNLLSTPYRYYSELLYPKIADLRGATFIKSLLESVAHRGCQKISEEPTSIKEMEWDNLVILDACRHDVYEDVFGESDYRISVGGATKEFIQKSFSGGEFQDTVYITANPHFYPSKFRELTGKNPEEVFHTVYNVYETDWDNEKGTVMPRSLVRDSISANNLFEDKKLIIHFMQPHTPFINSELDESVINWNNEIEGGRQIYSYARINKIDNEKVRKDYRDNLKVLEEAIGELREKLDGKTVVTADHGELLGENGLYGHFPGCKAKKLRRVPWDEL